MISQLSESERNVGIILIRDYLDPLDPNQKDSFLKFGEHNVKDSLGVDFIEPIKGILNSSEIINSPTIGIDLKNLRDSIKRLTSLDILDTNSDELKSLKVLLTGFHTEKRLLSLAALLKNYIGISNVIVTPHFMASTNVDIHFNALRYSYPDALVKVMPELDDVLDFLELRSEQITIDALHSCKIEPDEVRGSLIPEQLEIIETLCMHWDRALIKPLQGGFSGSLLLLASGWKADFKTEPMVLKIDTHNPIKKELDGYQLVKDLLGKHVPTFSSPVTLGEYSGISMELASMEGNPLTLQDYFESAKNDYELDKFLSLFDRSIELLADRVYSNTIKGLSLVPYRQFLLHIARQGVWLNDNIDHILKQKFADTTIDTDVVKKMFDLVRKNDDSIDGKMCLSHGDLNLANVISDERENLWAIDWTYTDIHPLEMDLTKLENDIKFVISKQFETEDFNRLQLFEDYLLSKLTLPELEKIPAKLQFVSWDLRFKKIYLAVKNIRETYYRLKDDKDWLIYRIGLLRYAIHTLSFDKSRDKGECGPVQLWYALYSVEQLLYDLVSDDFHLKIRGEKPADYPARYRISIDQTSWKMPCDDYSPPYYVHTVVIENDIEKKSDGWAHPEDVKMITNKKDFGVDVNFDDNGRPLNPRGRTGIVGRGALGRWGTNPYLILIITRINQETNELEILLLNDENGNLSLLEKFVKYGKPIKDTYRLMLEKILPKFTNSIPEKPISSGYLYDMRQTDNAWLFANAYSIHISEEINPEITTPGRIDMKWEILSSDFINDLSASRAEIITKYIKILSDEGLISTEIADIILKTSS
jgi:ADP-ribose pyrophosphatase